METNSKIALVTGSSRGLGKNAALAIAQRGIDVIVTYRSQQEEAEAVVSEIQAIGRKSVALPLDVANSKSFSAFAKDLASALDQEWQTNQFHFLINNAGIDSWSLFPDTTEEAFDNLMNVHLKGVYFLTQALLPYIADGGRIINLSTGLARFATPGYSAYAAMKGAIEVFTRYLAKELGHRKIAANVVAPGIIKTDFTKAAFDHNENLESYMNSITSLGRVGLPEDIGGIIAFLCTEEARWINAQRIEASGGMFL